MTSRMRVGILGGGQLARMLVLAGYPLGFTFHVYDQEEHSATAGLCRCSTGAFDDFTALRRFAESVDVVTTEFENVPASALDEISQTVPTFPAGAAVEVAQDRFTEKEFFKSVGIGTPGYCTVDTREELLQAGAKLGYPFVLKSRRFGYDGKGQWRVASAGDVDAVWREASRGGSAAQCIAEEFVSFDRELSVLFVRSRNGASACYPLVENVHRDGILRSSLAPAPEITAAVQSTAERYASAIAKRLSYVGVFALELFESGGR
ncbi:MAG: ATP-grasp domain-containing protein, partial [Bdellovibrionales bacterium]|nr:ATP-grasp domain-containing protein [Bdellovibrionales bacterium]